jgi:predicted nucleic acid-binding protein
VFNYYFDTEREFHADTRQLFEAIAAGEFEAYTSEYATLELRRAPEPKQGDMMNLIERFGIKMLEATQEANDLAAHYVRNGIIPAKYRTDGEHIACASVNGLDCILSFNFQHINKLKTKRMTEIINLTEGYKGITICMPMEVLDDEETE